jgi:hypothetical protein
MADRRLAILRYERRPPLSHFYSLEELKSTKHSATNESETFCAVVGHFVGATPCRSVRKRINSWGRI